MDAQSEAQEVISANGSVCDGDGAVCSRWQVHMVRDCPLCFFFQAEDGIRDLYVTGVQTCALPILVEQPVDIEVGAGTFHPATFLRVLGPEPWNAAFAQFCRRPADGRYGENPNRAGGYYQFQVGLKPSPLHVQELYLDSLRAIGLDSAAHDIRFVEDDWESPTLGAWGVGWEVWCDGMEVTQYTYFQQAGGIDLMPVTAELTYGVERLAMYLQNVANMYDLQWDRNVTYGQIRKPWEVEYSTYQFEELRA